MTPFEERLGGLAVALCERCDKDGCALRAVATSDWFLLDVDRLPASDGGPKCDCLLISRRAPRQALVVELKSGRSDARRAAQQLQACAGRVQVLLDGEPVATFRAVLLAGRINSSAETKILGRARVRFRGKLFPLVLRRCGTTLATLLTAPEAGATRA